MSGKRNGCQSTWRGFSIARPFRVPAYGLLLHPARGKIGHGFGGRCLNGGQGPQPLTASLIASYFLEVVISLYPQDEVKENPQAHDNQIIECHKGSQKLHTY